MRFYIVDDSPAIRAMLMAIIEEDEIGTVIGEAEDGMEITAQLLNDLHIDVLLIDLLMPVRDGIETIRAIQPEFAGKIIMISQVETKDMIGEAYSLGIEYYITKPINRLEVTSILHKVNINKALEDSLSTIHDSLRCLETNHHLSPKHDYAASHKKQTIQSSANLILSDLGISGESGHKDILQVLSCLYELEQNYQVDSSSFPSLKELYYQMGLRGYFKSGNVAEQQREIKAIEQRIRRAIHQSMVHIATLGLMDFGDPRFEKYAARYFEYSQIRLKMLEIENKAPESSHPARINIKLFIQMLYIDSLSSLKEGHHY